MCRPDDYPPYDDEAYGIVAMSIGRHAADDLIGDLDKAGYSIVKTEYIATDYELDQRLPEEEEEDEDGTR